jgi:hypothetical protein
MGGQAKDALALLSLADFFEPLFQARRLFRPHSQVAVQATLAAKLQAFKPEADNSEAAPTQRAAGLAPNGFLTSTCGPLHGPKTIGSDGASNSATKK